MQLALSTRSVDQRLIISVTGELDVHTAPQLREQFLSVIADGHYNIIVDLGGVTFLESTGLGVFISALKRINAHRGSLALVVSREPVLAMFRITGLTKIFSIHSTLEGALGSREGD